MTRPVGWWAAAGSFAVVVWTLAPLNVVLGANRLAVFALLGAGAWLTIRRVGLVDLAAGGVAGLGAYAGGVTAALHGLPIVAALALGAVVAGSAGALSAAVGGRVGTTWSALTSLSIGAAIVTVLTVWPSAGGEGGFHAVPLLTGSDRGDLVALSVLVVVAALAVRWVASSASAARASTALRAPHVSATLGRRPVLDAAVVGAIAGAVLGLGGAAGAAVAGSVAPGAYGLRLSAGLGLAALVGGRHPFGGVLGALFVWGPSVVWPGVVVVGDAPLVVMGAAGLALLAWRPSGLVDRDLPSGGVLPEAAVPQSEGLHLEVVGAPVPGGEVELEVRPGELVALVGPNGAGKSTLLARIGGQLDDGGTVRFGGASAPRGVHRRASLGVARTFQQRPAIAADDLLVTATGGVASRAAAVWARELLGTAAAADQLVMLAARRPRLALLDEPAADLDVARVARFVRDLADAGAAVLVVEHRPEVVDVADRVVEVGA